LRPDVCRFLFALCLLLDVCVGDAEVRVLRGPGYFTLTCYVDYKLLHFVILIISCVQLCVCATVCLRNCASAQLCVCATVCLRNCVSAQLCVCATVCLRNCVSAQLCRRSVRKDYNGHLPSLQ